MTEKQLPSSAQRFADAAAALGLPINIIIFDHSTRTAEEAAAAIGCKVGQIVKSLVFTVKGDPVMTLVSGANQLDTRKLASLFEVGRKQV
ncbi:MAG TPA: YbaK/EbsC family protein, partial [Promineifilum sp.]|nr:YbaK/EbsC family protein [Promineifilum sp.]